MSTPHGDGVVDWASDWDHTDSAWVENPYPILEQLQSQCPVAHTSRYNDGVWLPVSYADVSSVLLNPETFSSDHDGIQRSGYGRLRLPPIHSDPPDHRSVRRILLPAFTPSAAEALREFTRQYCGQLIEKLPASGTCDAALDYSQHISVAVMAKLLGVPVEDGDLLRRWITDVIEVGPNNPDVSNKAHADLATYVTRLVDQPEEQCSEVVLRIRRGEIEGEPLTRDIMVRMLVLLVIAGVDTTWSAIGTSLWHLAQRPDQRQALACDLSRVPAAVEEFLRCYAPVSVPRRTTRPTTLGNRHIETGDMLLVSIPGANRDPQAFDDANSVRLDRDVNRHLAFGLGIHRCLGSSLARMEMQEALSVWLRDVAHFELSHAEATTWSAGVVRGPRRVPLLFSRVGSVIQ
ncbi:cytochrome P450 [Streptomyces sp. NPDC057580]|uniref:cytochrome P450 n=1 Tax=Streptomyces sp. NPDC057580 TaxID=3346173 RepID=UPI003689E4DC